MKTVAVLQARTSSTRLPGKVLKPILGRPMLSRQLERLRRAQRIDKLVVATSDAPADDALQALCEAEGVSCFRGSLEDVLDRFYRAVHPHVPCTVLRLTGDCPLADPDLIDRMIARFETAQCDYMSNSYVPAFPDGLDAELMRSECLEAAWHYALLPSEREHVTPYLQHHPERFRIEHYREAQDLSGLRWTVDDPDDFELVTAIYEALYPKNPAFTTADILAWLDANPKWKTHNIAHDRNEGYKKSLEKDARVQSENLGTVMKKHGEDAA